MKNSLIILALFASILAPASQAQEENGFIDVLTSPIEIQHLNQARLGDVRMLVWNGRASSTVMGAFLNAETHQLLAEPFVLATTDDTVPCIHPDCVIDEQRITTSESHNEAPLVHADAASGQFLVVWNAMLQSSTTLTMELIGRLARIGTDGQPELDPLFRISLGDNDTLSGKNVLSYDAEDAAGVAFNPSRNEYLVTWVGRHLDEQDGLDAPQIYAQRLSLVGSPLGQSQRIHDRLVSSFAALDIGYDNISDRYLIVVSAYSAGLENGVVSAIAGLTLDGEGNVVDNLRNLEPSPVVNHPHTARLIPLGGDQNLLVYIDSSGDAVRAMWLDASESLSTTVAGRFELFNLPGLSTDGLRHLDLVHLPDLDVAVVAVLDTVSDGDGLASTALFSYRLINLTEPTAIVPSMTEIVSAFGYQPASFPLSRLTSSGSVSGADFVTFFADPNDSMSIKAAPLEAELEGFPYDVEVSSSVTELTISGGESFEVSIRENNWGSGSAAAHVLTIEVPDGIVLEAAEGCHINIAPDTGCTAESLIGKSSRDIRFFFKTNPVSENATQTIDIFISPSDIPDDADQANNGVSITVNLSSTSEPPEFADLALSSSDNDNGIGIVGGEVIALSLGVTNQGEKPATGVVLNINLPEGIALDTAEGCTASGATGEVACNGIADIGAGEQVSVTLSLTSETVTEEVTSQVAASVTSTTTDSDTTNNTFQYTVSRVPVGVDPVDPVDPTDPTPPSSGGGGGAFGLALLALVPLLRRRRPFA